MKISSASKKVLASALSAAMVVAFAPTVAFGAPGSKIAVTADINGGTGTVPAFTEAIVGGKVALPADVTFGTAKYALDGWYYDYNEDGTITQGNGDQKWNNADALPDQESIAFKAYYKVPSVTKNAVSYKVDTNQSYITVPLTDPMASAKDGFKVSLYGTDGHLLGTTAAFGLPGGATTAAVQFGTGASAVDGIGIYKQISADDVTYGTYTIKLIDAENEVISTETLTLHKVTVVTKNGSEETKSVKTVAKGGTINLSGYYKNEAGQIVTDDYTVKGDETLTSVDVTKGNVYSGAYNETNRQMSFTVTAPSTANASYVLSVQAPNGAEIYKKNIAAGTSATAQAFSFNPKATAIDVATATEAAGTYTATLTQTVKGGEGELDKVSSISTTVALAEIKYEAGENTSFKSTVENADKVKYTDDTASFTVATIGDMVNASEGYTLAAAWQLNGKALNTTTNKLVAGTTNVLTATAKANDVSKKIATPALESVTKQEDNNYTVKLSCATAGANVFYTTNGDEPTTTVTTTNKKYDATKGIKDVAKTATIKAIAAPVDGATPATLTENSLVLTLVPAANDGEIAAYKGIVKDGALEYYVGKTTGKWAAVESVAAAIAAGNAATGAVVFDTAKNLKALAAAQAKAVHDAVLAEAKAQLAAYEGEAMVIVGDKAYTIAAKDLKAAQDAVAAMEAYVAGLGTKAAAGDYKTAVEKYVIETNKALKGAKEAAVTAADITAAKAVTEALKAATTGEAAEAALATYAALTDAQKALVSVADLAAAQKVVDEAQAQAALVKEQDIAAVKYVNSTKTKTVKLATAKKGTASITYKSKVSASGNTVTYAKVSGSKIKVAASGKVTLKKVTKKGTYTGKVKVTCGDATRTVKVKFIVK